MSQLGRAKDHGQSFKGPLAAGREMEGLIYLERRNPSAVLYKETVIASLELERESMVKEKSLRKRKKEKRVIEG